MFKKKKERRESVIGEEDRDVGVRKTTENLSIMLKVLKEVPLDGLRFEMDIICFMFWKIMVIL